MMLQCKFNIAKAVNSYTMSDMTNIFLKKLFKIYFQMKKRNLGKLNICNAS